REAHRSRRWRLDLRALPSGRRGTPRRCAARSRRAQWTVARRSLRRVDRRRRIARGALMTARCRTAVILAAGAGTRLRGLGRRHSKAMLPIAGKPLIGWAIERLRAAQVDHLVVVVHLSDHELGAFVRAAGGDLVQQAERRGIGDALRLALPSIPGGV